MNEDSGIQKPGLNSAHLYFRFANSQVEAQVVSVADRIKKAVELAKAACDEWLVTGYGEDDIAKIAHVGAITVTKKSSVAEDQEASAVGIAADSDGDIPSGMLALLQTMPSEDLAAISRIVMHEFTRRSRPQNGDSAPLQSIEIGDSVAGAIASPSASALGDGVTNYKI